MIGTITWHFHNCVVICNDEATCTHAMFKEYENLETLLHDIKGLQKRPFVTPDYILVEYHGYVFNVTNENQMYEFHDFLANEAIQLAKEIVLREVNNESGDSDMGCI